MDAHPRLHTTRLAWRRGGLSLRAMSVPVQVYVTGYCPYCTRAKSLLDRRGIPYETIDVSGDDAKRRWLAEVTGQRTVPQIFIDGKSVGGCDDLHDLDRAGELMQRVGKA